MCRCRYTFMRFSLLFARVINFRSCAHADLSIFLKNICAFFTSFDGGFDIVPLLEFRRTWPLT